LTSHPSKKGNRKTVTLIAVLLSICLLCNYQVGELRSEEPVPSSSLGDFLGTVVLSGFRPLAVDILWMKADEMLTQRQYYQLLSIYELIAALDPHFESAWVFNSLNLAFRLSYLETTAEAQWQWVRRGLLFAQSGYEKNPHSDEICFAIAWIYYTRIPQNPEFTGFLSEDSELNPDKLDCLHLALKWAERGFAEKPHTVFLDWVLEFVYRDCAEETDDPTVKLHYQQKRLNLWNYFLSQRPEAQRAEEKIRKIEAEIAKLKKQIENENKR
jgi:hypothetical protein